MLYSEIIKHPAIIERLTKAGVNEIQSPIMSEGDFATPFDAVTPDLINAIGDKEILIRRRHIEFENQMAVHEERMKPFKKEDARKAAIRPHIEKLISGKLKEPFAADEEHVIDAIARNCVKNYEFEPDGTIQSDPEPSKLSGLDKLLRNASVIRLTNKLTLEEIALRQVYGTDYAKFLK